MIIVEGNIYVIETGCLRPIVVELITDEGITGIGEGAVGFGIGCNASAAMASELTENYLIGKDPANITALWNDFYYDTFWGKGAGAIFYSAVSALEMALWDIKGKTLGVPIYELLGGRQRDELQVYANGWSNNETPKEFASRAAEVVEDGFDALKVYPLNIVDTIRHMNKHIKNRNVDIKTENRCIEIVREVRNAIGNDVELMVDVTAEGTTDVMTRIGQRITEFRPYWYEEPLDAFDVDSYKILKEKLSLTIATGERLYTRYGFRRLLEIRGVDVVQPDPGTCGGIMEAFHIGAMAEAYSMRIAPHNCGGPILTAACVQLSAALTNFAMQEIFPYHPEIHYQIVTDPYEKHIKKGRIKVRDIPGIGVELNHPIVDTFLVSRVAI